MNKKEKIKLFDQINSYMKNDFDIDTLDKYYPKEKIQEIKDFFFFF